MVKSSLEVLLTILNILLMAIFKAVQKKMAIVAAVLHILSFAIRNINVAYYALKAFSATIVFIVERLRRILTFRLINIIRGIRNGLGKVGRFAGPLKFITTVLRNVLAILQNVIKPFEKVLKAIDGSISGTIEAIGKLQKMPQYKFLMGKMNEVTFRVDQINELAKLLEQQQEWIEKAFPAAFLNQIKAVVESLTAPLKRLKNTSNKIIIAIGKFTVKIAVYEPIVDSLKTNMTLFEQWLNTIEKTINTFLWIISQLEIALRRIPFLGYILDLLSFLSGIIDEVIRRSGIRDLLEFIVKNNIVTQNLLKYLNQVAEAIRDLLKDFKAILDDIVVLAIDFYNLNEILKKLHGLLRMIAAFKWLLEFRFPNILEKIREGLKKLEIPDYKPLTLSDDNSLAFSVVSVTIDGEGIGNDWVLHFEIGTNSYELSVDSSSNQTIQMQTQIYEETILKTQKTIQRTIYIAATELDPVYNDYGGMQTKEVIKLNNIPQVQEHTFSFKVQATGGDSGAEATITVQLKTALTENENVLLPLSNVGARHSGINYIEHAIHDIRHDMGTLNLAPGLYANMNALDQFLNDAELLLNKLKVLVMESPNDQQQKEQLIAEFYNLLDSSQATVQPARADQFEASYYMDLQNTLEEKELAEETTEANFDLDEFNFCLCGDLELDNIEFSETFEVDISQLPLDAQNFDINSYLNASNSEESNEGFEV